MAFPNVMYNLNKSPHNPRIFCGGFVQLISGSNNFTRILKLDWAVKIKSCYQLLIARLKRLVAAKLSADTHTIDGPAGVSMT